MISALAKINPTLPLSWTIFGSEQIRVGFVALDAAVFVGDLNRNQRLENFTEVQGRCLLVLMASTNTPQTHRILENVAEAIFSKNHLLNRPEARTMKQLFQSHLRLERSFFEEPAQGLSESAYQGFLLTRNKIYPLHREGAVTCYIHRGGRLLEFRLAPYQFVQLEPEDLFVLAQPQDMAVLLKANTLRFFQRAFRRTPFTNPTEKRGFQRVKSLLTGPLLGIGIDRGERTTKQKSFLGLCLTKNQWLLAIFFIMWAIALIVLPWL